LFEREKLGKYLFRSDPRNSIGIIKRFAHSPTKKLESGQQFYIESENLMAQAAV